MTGRHPTPDEMLGYCDGSAPANVVHRIERHVYNCAACLKETIKTVRALDRVVNYHSPVTPSEHAPMSGVAAERLVGGDGIEPSTSCL